MKIIKTKFKCYIANITETKQQQYNSNNINNNIIKAYIIFDLIIKKNCKNKIRIYLYFIILNKFNVMLYIEEKEIQ